MASYPNECCGLLVGETHKSDVVVTNVYESDNLTLGDPARSFELDPKLRFDVMREMESRNDGRDIIGHYHSHPDGPAEPSATDLSMVYETHMVWMICSVSDNGMNNVGAFKPKPDASSFDVLKLDKTAR